jgi:hypothetical protein
MLFCRAGLAGNLRSVAAIAWGERVLRVLWLRAINALRAWSFGQFRGGIALKASAEPVGHEA